MAYDDSEDVGSGQISALPTTATKHQGLFGSTGIQLDDSEMFSPITTKFLRHLNGMQESEIQKLRPFEGDYYDKRQECEVLKKEKEGLQKELESKKTLENVQKVMIAAGTITLGVLKFLDGSSLYVIIILIIISALLIVGGMFPVLRIGASK